MLGGDSVFGIVVKAACEGEHPSRDFEGKLITHLSGVVKNPPGGKLSNRYILLQIKADWAEMASTIGFPSWSCNANPCIMCGAHKGSMYCYDGVSLTSDPWGGKPTTYDSECSRCEIVVNVTSEYVRSCILEKGGLYSDPSKKAMGRLLSSDVAELRLLAGDRLEPASQPRDIYAFEHAGLPFSCTFWREQRDARRRILSWTHRRNPLLSESIGTSPSRTLHLDTLHTLYLGVFATFCHTVIHAMYRADLFNTELHGKAAEKANLDRFFFVLSKVVCGHRRPSFISAWCFLSDHGAPRALARPQAEGCRDWNYDEILHAVLQRFQRWIPRGRDAARSGFVSRGIHPDFERCAYEGPFPVV